MSALIHFIGLVTLVTSTATAPAPPHILIPRFHDIIKKENNVIRIPSSAIAAQSWDNQPGPNDTTDFFIGEQNIRIDGAGGFTNSAGSLPRLTCCCQAMDDGLADEYNKPGAEPSEKRAAYIFLDHGELKTAVDSTTSAVHIDLKVPASNEQVVITGTKGQKAQTIVVNVPSSSDLELWFLNIPDDSAHDSHWKSYYKMAKKANVCQETPKNDPRTCGPQATGCIATQSAKSPRPTAARKSVTTKAAKKAIKFAGGSHYQDTSLFVDINCSGSQWP